MVVVLLAAVLAQQPVKPPVVPAINPAVARLDQTIQGLGGPAFAVAYSDETGILSAGCEPGTIVYWPRDVSLGVRVGQGTPNTLHGHEGPVTALAWCGPLLASAGADKKIIFWEMPAGKVRQTLTAAAPVRALAASPDGKLLAAAADSTVQLRDVATGKPTVSLSGHTDWVLALAFSADGKLLASGGYDGTVRLWDVAGGQKLLDIPAKAPPQPNAPPPPVNVIQAVAISPDGKQLSVGGSDFQVHQFSLPDGKYQRSLPAHGSSVTALQYHPAGAVLVSASKDRTLRLWVNGALVKALEGHTAWVQGTALMAEGTRLASVGADETVRLWDLGEVKK